MSDTKVFRTGFSRIFPWVAAAVVAAGAVSMVAQRGWHELWRSGPLLALAVAIVWLLFALPRVEVSDGGIKLVNVVRTVWVAWPNFRSADAQWNLKVRTDDGREFSSWALPASSGSLRRLPKMDARRGAGAEAAAWEIGERVRRLTDAGFLPARPEAPVQVSLNRLPLLVLAAIAALAALSHVLG